MMTQHIKISGIKINMNIIVAIERCKFNVFQNNVIKK
jgi:hypothetical protein